MRRSLVGASYIFNFGGLMGQAVQLKKTVIVSVTAAKVTQVGVKLDDGGSVASVTGPVSVGDYVITDATGAQSVLSAADYAAELVGAAAVG
jgi:hypothetical protein